MNDAPLTGRRILVTRRPEQASLLIERLTELGAAVVAVPAIAIAAPDDPAPLDAALARISAYDWLIFTSGNAVRAVADRLEALGLSLELRGPRIAAVGPATSAAVADRFHGRAVDLEPKAELRAEGLLAAFADRGWPSDQRCLLPQGDRARDVVAAGLREKGARVDVVVAYRTVVPAGFADALAKARRERIDLALFASPSAVESFVAVAGERARTLPVAAIGPITAEAARAAGLTVLAVAESSTIDDLVKAAVRSFGPSA
jgi:uroporphyrinogen-III synthase